MIHVIETGHPWGREFMAACKRRKVPHQRIEHPGSYLQGHIFFQIDQYPPKCRQLQQKAAAEIARSGQIWIQDQTQIACYEDKALQAAKFAKWMPKTHVFYDFEGAYAHADGSRYPLVSKSREGASSYNVRILKSAEEGVVEVNQIFGAGLKIATPPGVQKGYWLAQEFIPHNITYRVTIVGRHIHIYQRFCYPDKAVAAPARVVPTKPVDYYDPQMQDLRMWAHEVFADIGTKFCAIDVLAAPADGWRLLETSLGWARGNDASANSKFYGSQWSLNTQWDLLLDEIEAGVFG